MFTNGGPSSSAGPGSKRAWVIANVAEQIDLELLAPTCAIGSASMGELNPRFRALLTSGAAGDDAAGSRRDNGRRSPPRPIQR